MSSLYANAFMAGIVRVLSRLMTVRPEAKEHKVSYSSENTVEPEMMNFQMSNSTKYLLVRCFLLQETHQRYMSGCLTPHGAWIIVKERGSKFLK